MLLSIIIPVYKECIDFLSELEYKRIYVNPQNGEFLKLVKKSDELKVWKVEVSKVPE